MRPLALFVTLAVTVASCGGTGSSSGTSGPAGIEAPVAAPGSSPGGTAAPADATVSSRPAFLTIPLTDVRTGERFTLGGFPGKVTFFIAMAVW